MCIQIKFMCFYNDILEIYLLRVKYIFFLGYQLFQLCGDYCSKGKCEGNCNFLHICKFYILSDTCRFGSKCNFSHKFVSHGMNKIKLQRHLCEHRTSVSVPEICRFYNSKSNSLCKNKNCQFLHLCLHYMKGDCRYGDRCSRSHDVLESHNGKILHRYGFPLHGDVFNNLQEWMESLSMLVFKSEGISILNKIHRPRRTSSKQNDNDDVVSQGRQRTLSKPEFEIDREVICELFLDNKCNGVCSKMHTSQPFVWRFIHPVEKTRLSFSRKCNIMLEKSFCDVNQNTCLIPNDLFEG